MQNDKPFGSSMASDMKKGDLVSWLAWMIKEKSLWNNC